MTEDLAYIAGFVDGEGCFQIGKNGSVSLRIVNTSRKVLEKIQTVLDVGSVSDRKQRINKRQFLFSVYGEECVEAIKKISPYLIEKLDEARLILEFRETCQPVRKEVVRGVFRNPHFELFRERLSALKKEESLAISE